MQRTALYCKLILISCDQLWIPAGCPARLVFVRGMSKAVRACNYVNLKQGGFSIQYMYCARLFNFFNVAKRVRDQCSILAWFNNFASITGLLLELPLLLRTKGYGIQFVRDVQLRMRTDDSLWTLN